MAKESVSTKTSEIKVKAPPPKPVDRDEEWVQHRRERYLWKPEDRCPLRGHVIGRVLLRPGDPREPVGSPKSKDWHVYVFVTTAETRAYDGSRELVDVPAGSLVIATANFQVDEALMPLVRDKSAIHEVRIIPEHQQKIDGGRKMWVMDIASNTRGKLSANNLPQAIAHALLAIAPAELPQLTAAVEDPNYEVESNGSAQTTMPHGDVPF